MTINFIQGNIFNSSCKCLINPVNCDGTMGKGLALDFKKKYPNILKNYKLICKTGVLVPGIIDVCFDYEKWILNFPTKIRWYNPSKIEYIELGLNAIVKLNEKLFLDSVAFPKIGSGLGGLDWIDVKKLIIKILSPLDLKIEVYE